MAKKNLTPPELLPLPENVWNILMALADGTVLHGYKINKRIGDEVGSRLGAATLYRTIHTMLEQGVIKEVPKPAGETSTDERRRYYQVTDFGSKVIKAEMARLNAQLRMAERKLALGGV